VRSRHSGQVVVVIGAALSGIYLRYPSLIDAQISRDVVLHFACREPLLDLPDCLVI